MIKVLLQELLLRQYVTLHQQIRHYQYVQIPDNVIIYCWIELLDCSIRIAIRFVGLSNTQLVSLYIINTQKLPFHVIIRYCYHFNVGPK